MENTFYLLMKKTFTYEWKIFLFINGKYFYLLMENTFTY